VNSIPETDQPPVTLHSWETKIAGCILLTTPLVISPATADSYLLPKYVWLAGWATLWLFFIAATAAKKQIAFSPLDWPILFLFSLFLLSILFRYRTPIQLRAYFHLCVFILLFYCFQRLWSLGISPETISRIFLLTAFLVGLYGLAQDYGFDFFYLSGGVRDWRSKVIATLGNPNFLAGYLAILLPTIIAYALREEARAWEYWISALVMVIAIACIVVTFSVGTATSLTISGLIGFGARCATLRPFYFPKIKVLVFIILGILPILWYIGDNPYNSHGRSLYREAWESPQWWSGMGSRRFNWRTTNLMIREQPLLGIGFGNYLTVHEHYQGMNYKIQGRAHDRNYVIPVDQPHFQLLETAAETGPLGVWALLWLFAAWFKSAWITLRADNRHGWFAWGAFLGVLTAATHTFSDFPFHLPASALAVTALASYHFTRVKTKPVLTLRLSGITTGFCLLLALAVCAFQYMELLGSHYLREGLERKGLHAIPYLETARWFDPYSHQIHFMLGIRYAEQGWEAKALESLHRALVYQEDHATHVQLAQIDLQRQDLPSAIQELKRVLELNPAYPGHYRDLAFWLRKTGDPQAAEALEKTAGQLEKQMLPPIPNQEIPAASTEKN